MKEWAAAGFPPREFFASTPREIDACFAGVLLARKRAHNDRAWLAYHVAALTRTRKNVGLNELLDKSGDRKRLVQAPDEMLAIAKMFIGMPPAGPAS